MLDMSMIDTKDPLRSLRDFDAVIKNNRTRFYSRLLDERLDDFLSRFNTADFPWGETADDKLDSHKQGWRGATNLTGLMAFCWANPMSRYHRNAEILSHVKKRLIEFAETQIDGAIVWKEMKRSKHFPEIDPLRSNLQQAWSIEPLVLAANWIADKLSEDERLKITWMARRNADILMALPCNERNNRGSVRCAVLCLLGKYLGDRHLVEAGVRDFHEEPLRIFNRNGQINEGPGPDANYSGTSFVYCYTYRIFSDDITVDEGVLKGARWYTWIADSFGAPTCFGASTRVAIANPGKISDFIPAMERYAEEHPSFNWLIENCYSRALEKGSFGHVVSPLIFALFEHNGKNGELAPEWFTPAGRSNYSPALSPEFRVDDEGTDSMYIVMRGKRNHTSVSLIGRFPYKGLQSWNYGLEEPVIWPTMTHASRTLAYGIDTSRMRIEGSKFCDRKWYPGIDGRPNMLISRISQVMNHYIQTDSTLLYLVSSPLSPREDIFIIDIHRCGEPILDNNCLRYDGREGRMYFVGSMPTTKRRENGMQLTFKDEGRTSLYAFSNESFELLEFEPDGDVLRFRDDTGTYRLDYEARVFNEDEMAPIGSKGLGKLFLSQMVRTKITVE